ncbi:MAG: hypothetical protein H6739_41840 [Alphaproteobacteria bacterium]|nr:hypothetical protein [Alphaproteobacteria bacterium]
MSEHNRWLVEQSLAVDSYQDAAARAALAADPRAALAAKGVTVPDGVAVTVLFDDPTHMHVVVPHPGHTFLGALDLPAGLHGVKKLIAATGVKALQEPDFLGALRQDGAALARANVPKLKLTEDHHLIVVEEDASAVRIAVPYVGKAALLRRVAS